MLYSEIIAVCSQIHTKHINTLCGGRTWNCLILNLVVHKVPAGLLGIKLLGFRNAIHRNDFIFVSYFCIVYPSCIIYQYDLHRSGPLSKIVHYLA
jgi:hypothetical protein